MVPSLGLMSTYVLGTRKGIYELRLYLEEVWTSIPIPAHVAVTRVLRISTSIAERCATAGQLFVQREVFTLKLSYDDVKLEDR